MTKRTEGYLRIDNNERVELFPEWKNALNLKFKKAQQLPNCNEMKGSKYQVGDIRTTYK